jgi:hypothetical protein
MSALNVFKTVTAELTTTQTAIYTAPANKSSIVLMAQISNITSSAATATFVHVNGETETELIKNYGIPGNDAASATTGKLVLEQGHSIEVSASANNTLKIVLSILETSN